MLKIDFIILSVAFLIPFILVNLNIPQAYMDEVFHFNQTLRFHRNNFTYDPKITTPPGLYVIYLLPAMNIYIARAFNLLVGFTTAAVLKRLGGSALLVLFPVSFFYHFLFYTDSLSTLLILLAYNDSKSQRYGRAGLICLISLLFRQTNIVWSLFIAISSLNQFLPSKSLSGFFTMVLTHPVLIFTKLWSFILTALAFGWFIIWNGGIALGDKSNHTISLHLPQILYFSAFTCFYLLPLIAIRKIPKLMLSEWFNGSILGLLAYYSIKNYS
jgi:alpha-1,2-glucosyltransferase